MMLKEMYNEMNSSNNEITSNTDYLNYNTIKTQNILDTGRDSEYLGKNIKYEENVYYLTNKGALKLYPSGVLPLTQGRNNCPVDVTTISDDPMGETFRENNPYVFTGTDMVQYGSGITASGQSCGNAGSNVFVGKITPIITEYRGCVSSEYNTMTNIGEANEVYTFDQCKELANKGQYTSFSVTPSEIWYTASSLLNENKTTIIDDLNYYYPSKSNEIFGELQTAIDSYKSVGQCYASKTAITSDEKIAYTPPELYTTKTVNLPLDQCTNTDPSFLYNLTYYGSAGGTGYVLLSRQVGVIEVVWNDVNYAEWILSRPNCMNGGGVDVINATYGANCSSQVNCEVEYGNFTNSAISNVDEANSEYSWYPPGMRFYPSSAQMYVGELTINNGSGTTGITYSPAPSPVPTDCACTNFSLDINYKCGNISKNIHVPTKNLYGEVQTAGDTITLDCTDNYNNCDFGIGISDLGDIKILQGINGTLSEVPNCLSVPPYNGTLISTSIPTTGVLATSQVTYNNITYNVFMAGNSSPMNNYGSTFGVGEMIFSPSGTCYITLGESGFLTITYYIKSNSCSNKSGNWVGLIPSSGTYVEGSTGAAPVIYAVNEILNETFIENLGKRGYVDDNLMLHEYPSTMLPTYTLTPEVEVTSGSSIQPTLTFTPNSVEQCEIICNGMSNCNYFGITGTQCTYYSTIGSTAESSASLYTKVQPSETNEMCPFSDTIISTSEWEYYAKGENMNSTIPCFKQQDNFLNKQLKDTALLSEQTKTTLNNQTTQTNQYLKSWRDSSTRFEKRISQIKKLNDNINKMNGIEGFNDIATINTMFQESQYLQKRNKYRNIFWSFLAITFLIMASRIIYLYLK
jgi:hypothetical protein